MKDYSNMVLRYYIGLENHYDRFCHLVNFLTKTGIHRVILFTAPFAGESSFLPEEYYKKHSQMLKPYMEKLSKMGIEVGINSLYTVGHAYYADENEFGFKRAVTVNGEPSRGCACMRDENMLKYSKKLCQYYAQLKPSVIFLDDDIRAVSLGQLVCLCEKHIKLISKRVGRQLTREQIKSSIFSEEGEPDDIKTAYFEQISEDTEYVITQIAEEIHKISPDTEVGIMTICYPDVTLDRNLCDFFGKNYNKKITRIRPGMGFYREGEHKEMPLYFSSPAIQRNFINDEHVEIQPEIENDTYGFFYKSNSVTNMQIVWCLSNGFRNLQLNLFDFQDVYAGNYDEITSMIAENMPMYNKISEIIPINTKAEGINIFASEFSLKYNKLSFKPEWYNYLQIDGLPLGYDLETAKWLMLAGKDISALSDDDILKLLKKGAVLDLGAAEVLFCRGFGKQIGIKDIKPVTSEFAGEHFTNNALNGKYQNSYNSDYFCSSLIGNDLIKDISYFDGAQTLSEIVDHRKNYVCGGVTAFENEKGERFCIIPTDTNIFSQFTNINNRRTQQLINVFEWTGRAELPVYACNEKVCININDINGKRVITLFNLTTDEIEQPKIAYRILNKLKYINKQGRLIPLKYDENGRIVTIHKNIKAMGTLVIVD